MIAAVAVRGVDLGDYNFIRNNETVFNLFGPRNAARWFKTAALVFHKLKTTPFSIRTDATIPAPKLRSQSRVAAKLYYVRSQEPFPFVYGEMTHERTTKALGTDINQRAISLDAEDTPETDGEDVNEPLTGPEDIESDVSDNEPPSPDPQTKTIITAREEAVQTLGNLIEAMAAPETTNHRALRHQLEQKLCEKLLRVLPMKLKQHLYLWSLKHWPEISDHVREVCGTDLTEWTAQVEIPQPPKAPQPGDLLRAPLRELNSCRKRMAHDPEIARTLKRVCHQIREAAKHINIEHTQRLQVEAQNAILLKENTTLLRSIAQSLPRTEEDTASEWNGCE
ncbi:hypothetical protein ACJ41O_007435 [Fusarium nematophilum]